MDVTRHEIAWALRPILIGKPLSVAELLEAAEATGVRPAVLELLHTLPAGSYRRPADLWPHLPEVPLGRL